MSYLLSVSKKAGLEFYIILDDSVFQESSLLRDAANLWNSYEVKPNVIDVQIVTDASHFAYGGVLLTPEKKVVSQEWNHRVSVRSSNYRELLAILMVLIAFKDHISNKNVEILSDNITAIAYINYKGGPNKDLTQIATAIWAEALDNGISITCKHVAGVQNEADYWSRVQDKHDWMLNPTLLRFIDRVFGPHTIDRFASLKSAQLSRFNSRYAEPLSEGVDALAQQNWEYENNFVNAPFCLMDKVVDTIIYQNALATVIAPWWPGQVWFRKLMHLSVAPPMRIPNHPSSFHHAGVNHPEPLRNRAWKLYAWKVFGGKT